MNSMSHKHAIRLIHRRQDGLLKEGQQSLLENHLHSCESCRAYALEMAGFSAHLQKEFHRRWDQGVGPSQNVTDEVMLKARKIPVTNRISSGVRVFAGALALVLLVVVINLVVSRLQSPSPTTTDATETMGISPLPEDRLLAFTSSQNGNSEIYTMHPDGSGLTNITNHPAHDGYPFWSPDGKQIAFMSDRDGSPHIYLMEAGGSDVIQLTQGEGRYLLDVNGYTPWSPDSRKLLYSYRSPEETSWNLYVLDIDERTSTALTNEPGQYILPSWSPDGEHIAFISTPSDRSFQQIFVVDKDGNDLAHLTETLTTSEIFVFRDYSWSQDGISITFSTHSHGQGGYSSAYKASLDGSLTVLARTDTLMVDWWNGTALQHDPDGKTLTWLRSDSSQSTLNLCQSDGQIRGIAYRRSHDGNLAFGSNCSGSGWMFYWANPDGTIVHELLDSPLPANGNTDHIFNMTWSPDDHYLAFVRANIASSEVISTLYVLDVAKAREDPSVQPLKMTNNSGLSWQPVIHETLVKEEPTPRPEENLSQGGLLAFTSDQSGNFEIYTMHPDGSGLTNMTGNPANDDNPFWSPNGERILFESDRTGYRQVFIMNADSSNVVQLTKDGTQYMLPHNLDGTTYPWSPDGSRILVLHSDTGGENWSLESLDRRGENSVSFATGRISFNGISWSPNGKYISYIVKASANTSDSVHDLFIVDANGGKSRKIKDFLPQNADLDFRYQWSPDGQSMIFTATQDDPLHQVVYEFDPETNVLRQKHIVKANVLDWEKDIYFSIDAETGGFSLVWQLPDGTSNTLSLDMPCIEFNFRRSHQGNYAIGAYCPDGKFRLYWTNADGSTIQPLLVPPENTMMGSFRDISWSQDDRYIAFYIVSSDQTTLYVLNVEEALQNPSIQPVESVIGIGDIYPIPSWQPVP